MGTHHDDSSQRVKTHFTTAVVQLTLVAIGAAVCIASPRVYADTVQTYITISVCGNGTVDPGETCDDGAGNNTGLYGPTLGERHCAPDCGSFGAYCGDGVLQVRFSEACDEGASNGGSGLCSATCVSVPAVPPSTPPQVLGSIPSRQGVNPGNIPSATKTQVVLRGKAYPNSDVSILLDGKQYAKVRADSNADFLYNTTEITPGTATFSFFAADTAGATSLTTSVVFNVVQSAVTSVNNIFLPPTISVSDRLIAPGKLLTIFGQSVPTAKVVTALDKDTSGTLASSVDVTGKWALQLDTKSISLGFHSAKAAFTLSTTSKSGFGKSVSFYVGNQLPKGGPSPDMNEDGKVNLIDFSIFLLSWNTHDVRADFNEDGDVNLADFSIMLFAWTG